MTVTTDDRNGRPAPLLEVQDLTVELRVERARVAVIDRVSFALERGRTLGLVGESGCGKSVTALALMGLLPANVLTVAGGSVRFDGRDLGDLADRARADLRGDRMTMIFQDPMTSLNPAFRIGPQIAEVVERHRNVGRKAALARALEMLRRVRVPAAEARFNAYPHQLSGGMRQRAMIAMALANEPSLLIADEPTTALDVTVQAQILDLVRQLQEETGTAVLLITHDLGVVAEVADEVAVMYAGRIAEAGPVASIFDDPQHPYTIGLMGSVPSLGRRAGRLAAIRGAVPPPERLPDGCRFAARCPFVIGDCVASPPPLAAFGPGHRAACIRAPIERHVGGRPGAEAVA